MSILMRMVFLGEAREILFHYSAVRYGVDQLPQYYRAAQTILKITAKEVE
jgi:hypothetical protein